MLCLVAFEVMSFQNMELLEFKDVKSVPDIIHPYPASLRNNSVPIVIDNGMYTFYLCIMIFIYEFISKVPISAESVGLQVQNLCFFLKTLLQNQEKNVRRKTQLNHLKHHNYKLEMI